jgi:serine/threonine-protein kinase
VSRIIDRYELQEKLGEGGMGVVWKAFDLKTGSFVAIKVMKDVSDPVAFELFEKEQRALGKISHPNIVGIRDAGVIDDNGHRTPFFVMPLLEGSTLADMINDASARLTVARIVEIAAQVCKGLQAAHQRGLIHRDLKPSNIFVMPDDTAEIIDFGIVHLAGAKTMTILKGTLQYMSPEQAQLKELSPASDIFSLGVVLYEALTRRKPFARNTEDETIQAVCKYMPPSISEINPSVATLVSRVVQKCLAKQPTNRFSSARELGEFLQKAYHNEPIFDNRRIQPRIDRAKAAFEAEDYVFASEILAEMESEGHLDPQITVLRARIDTAIREKRFRQLLESARARSEQDEVPLALDKIREVLELDPENVEALTLQKSIEERKNQVQVNKWLDLAVSHLENRDFRAARHAAEEVLAILPGDVRALEMLEKIESTESQAKRIREQKEHLFTSAMRAYHNGEIDTAWSKMDRLFALAHDNPEAAVPERDGVYLAFYKEVRSERETRRIALEETQRQMAEKNFGAASAKCNEFLMKHPSDAAFQALKIQIEDAERQELSAYIADVSRRVELEPDFDRRVNIFREACERYPAEGHFAGQLKLVRERRDLVNSIVARARQYEERAQFAEAFTQWDILRNIHPQHPGLAFELEQLKKKRDQQILEEEKNSVVEKIQHLIESRAYTKAVDLANRSLQEYPGDAELKGLQGMAEEGFERARESKKLFENGQVALRERNFPSALDLLRSALALDPRNPTLRDALVNALVEQARAGVDEDWRSAESAYQEASKLEAGHPSVRSLKAAIGEAKRNEFVTQCLQEVRSLVASGDPRAAYERFQAGLTEYPNDPRVKQYESTLRRNLSEIQRIEDRSNDKAVLERQRQVLDQNPDLHTIKEIRKISRTIRAKHPDDAEIVQEVAEIEEVATRLYPEPGPVVDQRGSGSHHFVGRFEQIIKGVAGRGSELNRSWLKLALGAVAAVVLVAVVVRIGHPPKPTTETSHNAVKKEVQIPPLSEPKPTPEPETLHISIQTPVMSGVVQLDGTTIAKVTDGAADYEMAPDNQSHTLRLLSQGQQVFSMDFKALPGSRPQLTSLDSTGILVIASLGPEAWLYSRAPLQNVQLGDQPVGPVTAAGVHLPQLSDQNRDLKYRAGETSGSVAIDITKAPLLIAHSLTSDSQVLITSNVVAATLTVDGQIVKTKKHVWQVTRPAGTYSFNMSADGYDSQAWAMTLQKGQTTTKHVILIPEPTKPMAATLIIRGGTSNAEVLIDSKKIGELDKNGEVEFVHELSYGSHVLILQKTGYVSWKKEIDVSKPEVQETAEKLIQLGSLVFNVLPPTATVRYQREGETQPRPVSPGQAILLEPGKYEISADAPGYAPFKETVAVRGGNNPLVPVKLTRIPQGMDFFQNPAQLTQQGEWFRLNNGASIAYLKPGLLQMQFTFQKNKVQWVVESADGKRQIRYELDKQKLKLRQQHGSEDHHEQRVDASSSAPNGSLSVHIQAEGSHIKITNDKGEVLDNYTSPESDFSNGRLGIKTDSLFTVHKD